MTQDELHILIIIVTFFVGLALGSFASMASYRLPRQLSWGGRSFCDYCGITLGVRDLVPVFTWAIRKGKCRCRQKKVSIRYPLMELGMGLACALAAWKYGLSFETLLLVILITLLVIIATIEIEHSILFPSLSLALMALSLVWIFLSTWQPLDILRHLIAGVILSSFTLLRWFVGGRTYSFAETLFLFAAGLWVGLDQFFLFFLASFVFVLIFALIQRYIYPRVKILTGTIVAFSWYGTILMQDLVRIPFPFA